MRSRVATSYFVISKKDCTFDAAIFTLTITLGSCTGDGHASRIIARADSLATTQPDSAIALLTSLPDTALSPHHKAHRALLLAKASMMATGTLIDDSTIHLAAKYYAGRADSLEYQSMFYSAIALEHRDSLARALITLADAERLAATHDDYLYLARIQREIGEIYGKLMQLADASLFTRKAIVNFQKAGLNRHAAWEKVSLANHIAKLGKQYEALDILNSIHDSISSNCKYLSMYILLNKANIYIQISQPSLAQEYIDKVEKYNSIMDWKEMALLSNICYLASDRERGDKFRDFALENCPQDNSEILNYTNYLHDYSSNDLFLKYSSQNDFSHRMFSEYEKILFAPTNQIIRTTLDNRLLLEAKEHRSQQMIYILIIVALILLTIVIVSRINILKKQYVIKYLSVENLKNKISLLESEILEFRKEKFESSTSYANIGKDNLSLFNKLFQNSSKMYIGVSNTEYSKKQIEALVGILQSDEVFELIRNNLNIKYNGLIRYFEDAFPNLSRLQYKIAIWFSLECLRLKYLSYVV